MRKIATALYIGIEQMRKYHFSEELIKLRETFGQHLREVKKLSPARIIHVERSINFLYEYLTEKKIKEIPDLTEAQVQRFHNYLYRVKHYTPYMIMRHFNNLNIYCRHLHHHDLIWKNPFSKYTRSLSPCLIEKRQINRYYNFNELLRRWKRWMKHNGEHVENVRTKLDTVGLFINFLKDKGHKTIYKIDIETIEAYKQYLLNYEYAPGKTYSFICQLRHLRHLCQFLIYLHRDKLIRQELSKHIVLKGYYQELNKKLSQRTGARDQEPGQIRIANPEIKALLDKFIQYHLSCGRSKETVRFYIAALEKFCSFIDSRGITHLNRVTKRDVMDFQIWLAALENSVGERYSPNTLQTFIFNLRSFFKYLVRYDYLACDPVSAVEVPRGENALPRACMNEREVKVLLNQPDITTSCGLRDRAIMEVFYSTGIRVKELAGLKPEDIDFSQGLLKVTEPKGGKSFQRIVPIGRIACEYVKKYLSKARPVLCRVHDEQYLFVSKSGRKLRRNFLSLMMRQYRFHSGLKKQITCHSFRVSCATHMLKNKADIRYVQEQLGHRSIRSTQIYTRLVPKDLKVVHTRSHPREKILENN